MTEQSQETAPAETAPAEEAAPEETVPADEQEHTVYIDEDPFASWPQPESGAIPAAA